MSICQLKYYAVSYLVVFFVTLIVQVFSKKVCVLKTARSIPGGHSHPLSQMMAFLSRRERVPYGGVNSLLFQYNGAANTLQRKFLNYFMTIFIMWTMCMFI